MTNVVFFTSGMVPTSGESANIAELLAVSAPAFTTNVQNGGEVTSGSVDFSPTSGAVLIGAIPAIYSGSTAYTSGTVGSVIGGFATAVIGNLMPNGAVVTSGEVLSTGITGSGTSHITLHVSGGLITGAVLS